MLINTRELTEIDYQKISEELMSDQVTKHELAGLERMESIARELAQEIHAEKIKHGTKNLIHEIHYASQELLHAYLSLTKEGSRIILGPATEWFLDNFHVIEDQLRTIKRDLPKNFYYELPKIKDGRFKGYPRVSALAQTIVNQGDARLDIATIERFTRAFQEVTPLTIGEIWAVAITLRISLIQRLLPIVRRTISSKSEQQEADKLADEILELAVKQENPSDQIVEVIKQSLCHKQHFNRPFIVRLIQRLRDQDSEIFKAMEWLEEALQKCHTSTLEVIQVEHYRQAADQVSIGNIITSMRLFSTIDWHDFFESVSLVDPILAQDPTGTYLKMDIATRDSYRKEIERLAKRTGTAEIQVARLVLQVSQDANLHVGNFLFGEKLKKIEKELSYQLSPKEQLARWIDQRPEIFYFVILTLTTIFFLYLIINYFSAHFTNSWQITGTLLLLLLPVGELSIGLLNYAITLVKKPKRLPKMDYKDGVPAEYTTMVVVPCMFTSEETVKELVNNLEIQYLANHDENIYFALLGDLTDAKTEVTEDDSKLLSLAHHEISELNLRYKGAKKPRFYVFHRARRFNPNEQRWMGHERKRGKLQEFNRLLRGALNTTYLTNDLDYNFLATIKYIITLDADTQLPLHNARRFIGIITHPLNQPVLDEKKNIVKKGFGIIQPRVSISLVSAAKTRFAQIFSGNTGIDPYTTTVSDVYQDLFGEGNFTGKGLYDVDIFEKVLGDRVPENSILSHDLFEGSFTRVALVSDYELIDDYPSNFETFCKRSHRWTRGDWQLIPWLMPKVRNAKGEKVKNDLPLIARWKIFDNLRRSILAPVTLVWLLLAWFVLPGPILPWTVVIMFTISGTIFAAIIHDFIKRPNVPWPEHIRNNIHSIRNRIEQVFLMVVYMPEISLAHTDAVIRTLYRVFISRKKMLEWTTFSQIQGKKVKEHCWKDLISVGPLFALTFGFLVLWQRADAILCALPFLASWLITPYITNKTQKPLRLALEPLSKDECAQYRRYARITWHYFETFAGIQNNWLAPDNFQEDPKPVVAHRTSPTNIGIQLLATLSAYDFGFIGMSDFLDKIENAFTTIHKLDRLNGHFFNWYNTQTLEPLHPRYISTVDSGNLAGHLITLKQACLELAKGTYININARPGLKDSLLVLQEYVTKLHNIPELPRSGSLKRLIAIINKAISTAHIASWKEIYEELNDSRKLLADLITDVDNQAYQRIIQWMDAINVQILSYQKDEETEQSKTRMRLKTIAYQAHELAHAMDFKFLYDDQRRIFVIGHNVSESRRDESFYDLLASESRLASFFAISKGDISEEHWFSLGRQLTSTVGSRALISWSATMFEYLMPLLVMKRFEETLLDQTYESVVRRQIEYGEQRQIPWGISEAGYNARDLQYNYQYGPFGIPGLGLKRGLRDELVVSPYSTMLAAMILPKKALSNLIHLEKMHTLGHYGFYESIDYTPERVPKNKKSVILHSYMAHHQGMSLLAINNLLHNSILQERFHSDARNQAIQLLLQERIPAVTEITKPRAEETHIESFARTSENSHSRIYSDPSLTTPRTQILSNGTYSLMVTSAGSGYSLCQGRMINRWNEDTTQDNWGQYIFIKNLNNGSMWSSGFRPSNKTPTKYEAIFGEDKVDLYREDGEITTNTEIIVSSEDNVELRKVSLINRSSEVVEIEVTSYLEIALAKATDDWSHPAFSKLFVQTEFCPQINTLLAARRPRSSEEKEHWGLHTIVVEGEIAAELDFETDRAKFIGRGRTIYSPIAMISDHKMGQTIGAVLDPIFSFRQKVRIPAKRSANLIFTTGVASSKEEAMRLGEKYHDPTIFTREVNLGWVKSQVTLRHLNINMSKAHIYQRLGGRILYQAPYLRAQPKIISKNQRQQSALWAYGISGDIPILLARIHNDRDIPLVRDLLHAHEYLRLKGLIFDLVILNEHSTSYLQTLQDEVMRQILISGNHHFLDKPGGIFARRSDLIPEEDLILLKTVARVSIIAERGSLKEQLLRRPVEKDLPPLFISTVKKHSYTQASLQTPELVYFNGLGGFTSSGKEYIIHLKNNQWTPTPWINVIANKNNFGFLISESGQGYTWSGNSRENKLSSWSNDPVSDTCSEAIYLRDEETGSFWSPTPLPVRSSKDYLIHHGSGYSQFELNDQGMHHDLTCFVPVEDSVKIMSLNLKNESVRSRKISLTAYIEWVLGISHAKSNATIVAEWDQESSAILATNTFNNEFSSRVAFIAISELATGHTCDRHEFIGRNGTMESPASMRRQGLSGREGGGHDSCGAIQCVLDMAAGENRQIIILIGQGSSKEEARALIQQYRHSAKIEESLTAVKKYWEETLSVVEVKTPDTSMDLMVNRWLLYQTLSCRYWARSALYQSGGAFGFRDQLQDVMALVYSHPEITRGQILLAASRQFPEGDVQHWWHPPTGRGVRTRFSDDLLWLPYVVSFYLEVTGDDSILQEVVPYIKTSPLTEGHDESYTLPVDAFIKENIYDHCTRAIDRSLLVGAHGLPLFGSGDWNDGMNRVGHLGQGESVWMAWFLAATLKNFIPCCEKMNDSVKVQKYQEHISKLKKAVEENAWDGDWYLRAYFDNGEKMGSRTNEECQIDAIAQSWSVISGLGDSERAKKAMNSVDQYLIDRKNKIVKLFTPPFDKSAQDPGYIKGYVPGVRENGGQYTHAAIWTMMAFAFNHETQKANELFSMINPINHAKTPKDVLKYKVEPYVICADIYGVEPHVGRGGWSWYTGSASWMYRAALETLLGFKISNAKIAINPCIPQEWPGLEITYRRGKTIYEIKVNNNQEVYDVTMDGKELSDRYIPILDDEKIHHVTVRIMSSS